MALRKIDPRKAVRVLGPLTQAPLLVVCLNGPPRLRIRIPHTGDETRRWTVPAAVRAMYASQQERVSLDSEHGPPLVAKRSDDVADQEVRRAATPRAEQRDSRGAGVRSFVQDPVGVQVTVEIRSCHRPHSRANSPFPLFAQACRAMVTFSARAAGSPVRSRALTAGGRAASAAMKTTGRIGQAYQVFAGSGDGENNKALALSGRSPISARSVLICACPKSQVQIHTALFGLH